MSSAASSPGGHLLQGSDPGAHAVAAFGLFEGDTDALAPLRRAHGTAGPVRLTASFHRHSDDQAVACLEAVFRAIRSGMASDRPLENWGVVAAPRYLGRLALARAIPIFDADGPGTASPFLITHHSLHSVASTISVALGLRGPCIGAGGGEGCLAEGLVTALSLFDEGSPPGLWAVFSEWSPEPLPDGEGRNTVPSVCRAVALALLPRAPEASGLQLRLQEEHAGPTTATVAGLARFLEGVSLPGGPRRWACPLKWGGCVELRGRMEGRGGRA